MLPNNFLSEYVFSTKYRRDQTIVQYKPVLFCSMSLNFIFFESILFQPNTERIKLLFSINLFFSLVCLWTSFSLRVLYFNQIQKGYQTIVQYKPVLFFSMSLDFIFFESIFIWTTAVVNYRWLSVTYRCLLFLILRKTNTRQSSYNTRLCKYDYLELRIYTVERQWLEHLWDHGNLFETWVVRATEGLSWRQVRKQIAII